MTKPPPIWTPKSILEWTEDFLQRKGVPSPRLDAELLLAHVLECQRIDLYLQFQRPLEAGELSRFRELVRLRGGRKPVAYLLEEAGFWNLTLRVTEATLIPGPDTEILVEGILAAISALRATAAADSPLLAVELGTGTGAVPLAVCSEAEGIEWIAVEHSPAAMAVAAENKRRHAGLLTPRGNTLHLVLGDRFESIRPRRPLHLIAGNPPYIPTGSIDGLMPEVSGHMPRMALDGGVDGEDFQRYLLDFALERLAPGGRVVLEMGAEQSASLAAAIEARQGLALVEIRQDLAGHDRVLHGERTD
ncbi:MAG: peptide chain release factor N(5)-glutamine methyltransferase [SAR324 cluster bacterium]|nr:peptide chain release factor N(5)-glutamine methyltransferase [SAR324 cluster bacterium]